MRARLQIGRQQAGPLLLFLGLATGGCACQPCQPEPDDCAPYPAVLDCQAVMRGPFVPDVLAVPIHSGVRPEPIRTYCNLLERDAQCLAATNSPAAALLEQEAAVLAAQRPGVFHHKSSDEATPEILRLRAVHERNRFASLALVA